MQLKADIVTSSGLSGLLVACHKVAPPALHLYAILLVVGFDHLAPVRVRVRVRVREDGESKGEGKG